MKNILSSLITMYRNSTHFHSVQEKALEMFGCDPKDETIDWIIAELNSSVVSFVIEAGGLLKNSILFDLKTCSLKDTAFFDRKSIPICLVFFVGQTGDVHTESLMLSLSVCDGHLELTCQD